MAPCSSRAKFVRQERYSVLVVIGCYERCMNPCQPGVFVDCAKKHQHYVPQMKRRRTGHVTTRRMQTRPFGNRAEPTTSNALCPTYLSTCCTRLCRSTKEYRTHELRDSRPRQSIQLYYCTQPSTSPRFWPMRGKVWAQGGKATFPWGT